jgi:hypothetical protein
MQGEVGDTRRSGEEEKVEKLFGGARAGHETRLTRAGPGVLPEAD